VQFPFDQRVGRSDNLERFPNSPVTPCSHLRAKAFISPHTQSAFVPVIPLDDATDRRIPGQPARASKSQRPRERVHQPDGQKKEKKKTTHANTPVGAMLACTILAL